MSLILNGTDGITFPNSTEQASAGQVLQVVNATYSTYTVSTTSTFADTGLTATITPKFTTSKILVLITIAGVGKAIANTQVGLQLLRGTTSLVRWEDFLGNTASTAAISVNSSLNWTDSPATTSATTYKVQFNSFANTASVYINNASSTATSTITLMEIAQ